MEFIGYIYSVKDLKEILDDMPDYYSVAVKENAPSLSTPEVYRHESAMEIVIFQ